MSEEYRMIFFEPEPDITVFELAVFFANVGGDQAPVSGILCTRSDWEGMGKSRRHWRLESPWS
ncbi:hypothetical protein [Bradyrhizobium sp. Tv2a-2]|uniref:hypothetical protein n=1 Tax=Bradyrhizobium sp. Tv2a-2 TaxID=113395 RepID=UPI0005601B2A|nr:hypothetical protein [Bradyrhizobium sp. Tv2a-2]